jgi:hypothetical protein
MPLKSRIKLQMRKTGERANCTIRKLEISTHRAPTTMPATPPIMTAPIAYFHASFGFESMILAIAFKDWILNEKIGTTTVNTMTLRYADRRTVQI